jgi:Tol biopolymer transport system component
MTIAAGSRVGPYEITAKLGEGGMGEVYRAHDTKLKRDVAIKVLPAAFTEDKERLARFEREAQLLAQLHHPNIASIFGLEESEGTRALIMELVEGPTLAERLEQGPFPFNEGLSVSLQIAQALEEAHGKGIIHRDLKPQNIKASIEGRTKVLDFGLAKAMDPAAGSAVSPADLARSPTLMQSPTLTAAHGTQLGVILGTAAYMAPEQARGVAVDKRADIWAFGVVLYEMLVGRSPFAGDTVTDTLAGVLKTEIDFSKLPAETPSAIRRLLRRCLERNPKNRLHDIADARIVLDELLSGRSTESATPAENGAGPISATRRVALAAGAALLVALGAAGGWLASRPASDAALPTTRLSIHLPSELAFEVHSIPGHAIAISRDGMQVAYVGDIQDQSQVVVRALGESSPRVVATVEKARQPFFSPDGKWIGYFGSDSLHKVSLDGGQSVLLVPELSNAAWVRGSWSDDGRIVYDTWNAGLRVVSADGGEVRVLTQPDNEWHLGPEVIPGTATVLFFSQSAASFRTEAIGLDGSGRRTVLDNASQPRFLASGHLLFQRDGGLFVAPFDAKSSSVTGPAMPLSLETMVDDERAATPVPQLAIGTNGTLVYAPRQPSARAGSELLWVDRLGKTEPLATLPFPFPSFDLSPDGGQLALAVREGSRARLALYDLARRTLTPLRDERVDIPTAPVFSADGREVYFARYGTHRGEILAQGLEGGEPRLLGRLEGTWISPYSVSQDGRWLVGTLYDPKSQSDIWFLDLTSGDPERAARAIAATGDQLAPALSPDGRWLAYAANDTGAVEIFLQRFPDGESKVRVSSSGGEIPRWSPDGRELFFLARDGRGMMAVAVKSEPKLELGAPRKLFDGAFWPDSGTGPTFAFSVDGGKFAMAKQAEDPNRSLELIVVQNWFTELGKLFPATSR